MVKPLQGQEAKKSDGAPIPRSSYGYKFLLWVVLYIVTPGVVYVLKYWDRRDVKRVFERVKMDVQVTMRAAFGSPTHWCVLNRDLPLKHPSQFDHFPHCMELALPCWSWFVYHNATNNCGFVLLDGLKFDRADDHTWQNQLIRNHMNCHVVESSAHELTHDPELHSALVRHGGVFYTLSHKFLRPRYGSRRYLSHPEDAQALRRKVGVSDQWVQQQKGDWEKGDTLQIGIIRRTEARSLTNLPDIIALLEQSLPGVKVDVMTLANSPNVLDQAKWFASKHIIIGVHGEALTNSVFITPKTFVLQIYPPGMHWQSLDPLIEQAGGFPLEWHQGDDPVVEQAQLYLEPNKGDVLQRQNFAPPAQEIVDIVLVALGKKEPTAAMIAKGIF